MRSRWPNCAELFTRFTFISACLMGGAGEAGPIPTVDPPPSLPAKETALPISEALREKVRLSEDLGRELWIIDKMAAVGTDVMLENLNDAQEADICGYVVVREGNVQNRPTGSWLVQFFVDEGEPKIGYRVLITPPATPGRAKKKFEAVTPPRKATEGELALFRSIRTAFAAVPDRPNQPVNPVTIPAQAIGEEGILVYLLAGTKRDNVAVMGKHYRVLVSDDGLKAKKVEPLTRGVLETPFNPPEPGSQPAGLTVTHLLGDYPLETHVFISNLHRLPLFVGTEKYIWCISEGKVRLVSLRTDKGTPGR